MTVSRSTRARTKSALTALLAGSLLTLAGCGDDLLLPSAGQPAKISIASGDHQSGTVGQPLGLPLVVLVTDVENRPVAGAEVAFIPPPGGVLDPSDTVTTDANGQAEVRYTLSTVAGDQLVEARATPVVPTPGLTISFTASASAESAISLAMAGGDGQTGAASAPLRDSLAVRALDRFGNGVAGVEVTWEANGGAVSPTDVTTGADGRAAAERTLGERIGTYRTTATAAGLDGSPVSFAATAVPAQLVLVTQPSATGQAGVPLGQQPELQLQDPFGAPLSRADVGVTVGIATGGGSLGGNNRAQSDAGGRVRFTDLSIRGEPGTRTLIFAAEGFSSATSNEIVVAPGPPAPNRSSATVGNGVAGAATGIAIQLQDEFGTPVPGAAASIAITVSGANQVPSVPVADQGNGTYSASYTPTLTGIDLVSISVNSQAISGSPFSSTVAPGPASPVTTTAQVTREGFIIYTMRVLVTTQDAQGNLLGHGGDLVQVQPNGAGLSNAEDRGDGTYLFSFTTFDPGQTFNVFLNGVPLAGNPFGP